MLTFGIREILLELSRPPADSRRRFDFTLERFQQSRDGDQYGYPLASDRFANHSPGLKVSRKMVVAPSIGGRKIASSWPKTWLKREEIEKSQRMENTLVAQVR